MIKKIIYLLILSIETINAQNSYRIIIKFKDNVRVGNLINQPQQVPVQKVFETSIEYKKALTKMFEVKGIKESDISFLSPASEKELFDVLKALKECSETAEGCDLVLDSTSISNNYEKNRILAPLYDPKLFLRLSESSLLCFQSKDVSNILNYFSLCHCNKKCIEAAKKAIEQISGVEGVEIEIFKTELNDPYTSLNSCNIKNRKEYWNEINMSTLWKISGGTGKDSHLILIENSSTPYKHCKYEDSLNVLYPNSNSHATFVLGILKSVHKPDKCSASEPVCLGLVPNAHIKAHISYDNGICTNTSSIMSETDGFNTGIYNALFYSLVIASPGDIVNLPVQVGIYEDNGYSSFLPPEALNPVRDMMKFGNCNGVTFIEAAGNGNMDLSQKIALPTIGIIVGATSNFRYFENCPQKFTKYSILNTQSYTFSDCSCLGGQGFYSNFGNNISCYQIGKNILTTNTSYGYCNFMATSASSTIITGMAASVQSIAKNRGRYLTPSELKNIFESEGGIQVRKNNLYIRNNTFKFVPTGDNLLFKLNKLIPYP
jgi:hypothetical protein